MSLSTRRIHRAVALPSVFLAAAAICAAQNSTVKVWEESTTIPTYLPARRAEPDVLLRTAVAGSAGPVYPYPLYDILTEKKVDKHLQDRLSGERVRADRHPAGDRRAPLRGLDKTNNYDFIYRQHVIKPALIGLIGAWISGGVEWNIPHHHRATTFLPVQYKTWKRTPTAARPSGWASWKCASACAGPSATRCVRASRTWRRTVRIVNRTPVVNTMLVLRQRGGHTSTRTTR